MWKVDETTKENWMDVNEQVKDVHKKVKKVHRKLMTLLVMILVWGGLLIIVARTLWG